MKRGILGIALLAAAAIGLAVACGSHSQEDDCARACKVLDSCELLPSALGRGTGSNDDRSNCQERCTLSDERPARQVIDCTDVYVPPADRAARWCDGSRPCAKVAACLRNLSGTTDLAGEVSVRLNALQAAGGKPPATPRMGGCVSESCEQCAISQECSCGTLFLDDDAKQWCIATGASIVQPFVEQDGTYAFGDPVPCAEGITRAAQFRDLTPGRIRAGMKARGADVVVGSDGGLSSTSTCRVFFANQEVVVPSSRALSVPLPTALEVTGDDAGIPPWKLECEGSAETCSDHRDNDGDGAIDCQDVKCAPFCAPARTDPDAAIGGRRHRRRLNEETPMLTQTPIDLPMRILAFGIALASAAFTSGCTSDHIRLDAPGTSPGSDFVCAKIAGGGDGTGPDAIKCQPSTNNDPKQDNPWGTIFINLPKECHGRFNRIMIHDVSSSNPKAHVICAPPENPITEAPK